MWHSGKSGLSGLGRREDRQVDVEKAQGILSKSHVDTTHRDISKTVTPANYLIPVCQPGLSITMNTVEDVSTERRAGQEGGLPLSFHTLDLLCKAKCTKDRHSLPTQPTPSFQKNQAFRSMRNPASEERRRPLSCMMAELPAVDFSGMDTVVVTVISHHGDFASLTDRKFQNAHSAH